MSRENGYEENGYEGISCYRSLINILKFIYLFYIKQKMTTAFSIEIIELTLLNGAFLVQNTLKLI